jgi:hypothetical protein
MNDEQVTIYTPLGLDGSELCHPLLESDFERINVEINGVSLRSSWKPIKVRIIQEDEGRALVASDSPWLGQHALIFRPRVIEAMGSLLREHGELLPLACNEAELTMYNATRVLNALNEQESSVHRFANGRIMMIQRYVFLPEKIHKVDIFKLSSLRVSPTFVTRRFVDLWKSAKLKGLEFKQVWPTE